MQELRIHSTRNTEQIGHTVFTRSLLTGKSSFGSVKASGKTRTNPTAPDTLFDTITVLLLRVNDIG